MISDRLYELAFEYKKTKLWQKLWDTEMFAVKLPDGTTGYISIMGAAGEHCALGLYLGEEGFDGYRTIARGRRDMCSPFAQWEFFLQQSCLQCAFENKDELTQEEREEAKRYARAHGIKIAGRNAYPRFVKYQPNCVPWHLQTEQEQEALCEALAAAIEVAKLLKEKTPEELGLNELSDETREIPMLERRGGAYVWGKAEFPEEKPKRWPAPEVCNEIGVKKLKKADREGIWECEVIRFPEPVQDDPEEIPVYPVTLLAVEASTNYILPVMPVTRYEDAPEELLNAFIDALLREKVCPIAIKARDARTYVLVRGFCDKLKIAVNAGEELPALDDAEQSLMEHFDMAGDDLDELFDTLNAILEMDDDQLRELPPGMIEQLKALAEEGVLPEELEDTLKRRLDDDKADRSGTGKSAGKKAKAASKRSYVISVSLGTGCYRHIRISGGSTLFELHAAILKAFEFDDDHAHAFFMDNQAWSDWDCYVVRGLEEDGDRTTDAYRLEQVGLCEGKRFKYLFDFGDEWIFQCKVLHILEESTAQPEIVRSKGEAPAQYGGWQDE